MSFSLSVFIKGGLIKAVGHMADYAIILNAAGWLEKGVLTETDLAQIQTAIDAQYIVPEDDASSTASGPPSPAGEGTGEDDGGTGGLMEEE